MGLGRHARLQSQFHGAKHGLFVMVQHQGQDIDHFAVPARLAQYLRLQQTEGLRHFHEGSTIAQRAGFALNDCQIVAPIIDDAPRLARVIWAMLTTGKEYRDAERAMAA
ncbi:hypothetical protein SAMN05421641_1428 [Paracoccus thiocyanatus]|uniref:Uncharacterized protein n=1 Tax=Paracoccus thiocyanatus TaxID=34006 RepID=A0A1N7A4L9_9RHOB|nr:hypothetical protein SAMN05421641_1428 [Paracoccus thiocyanatus]